MSKTINLGRVTAYADAVAAGYTGTREQFANDLANAANYAAEAGDAAETATEAATTASTAAETATTKAEEASADADQAHADAQAIFWAKETAVVAANTASSKAGEAANSAQQAAASETAAAGSATTASNAATSATESKNAAATSETNAAKSANAAAQTLTNVNQAGATQVAAIQAKGTEVLNSIPADYTSLSNDVDDLKSDISDFVSPYNLISDVLSATISNIGGNYTLYPNNDARIIIFPVVSGEIYTVYKGYTMPYARIAYSQTVPELNGTVTGYGDFSSNNTYKTFTAAQTGYACVLIHAVNDAESVSESLASAYVYHGDSTANILKQNVDLKNVITLNEISVREIANAIDLFENIDILEGYIQGLISDNTIVAGTPYALCVYFPVTSGETYTLDKKIFSPYTRIGYTANVPKAGDSVTNYSVLDGNNGSIHQMFTAVASGYATIFVSNTTLEIVDYIKNNAIVYKGQYNETYSRATRIMSNNVANMRHIFYCGATRELNTLVRGIEEAEKYMDSILYVDPGTYDLVSELGQSYFDNATSTSYGIILKNRIHIIFSSNSKVVSHYNGTNSYAHSIYSPFNSGEYGFTLENLNIECSNCRYVIHDESKSSPRQFVAVYKNCKMYLDNSANPDWNSRHCIGGGLGANCEITIDNCIFGNDNTEIRWGVSYHIPSATSVTSYRSVLLIKGCYFESGTVTLQTVDGMPISTSDPSEYIITNNSFSKKYPGTDSEGVYNTFTHSANVREWNNVCRETA